MSYFGELAALGTAFCWAAAATCFTSCGRRIGAFATNHYRVLWASLFLMLTHLIFLKTAWPSGIHLSQYLLISLGGVVGIVIGDTCLLQSYVDVGPRLGLLVFSSYPLMTVLLAWFVFGESLSLAAWCGFSIALLGVFWVVKEKKGKNSPQHHPNYGRGVIMGICAAFGQALGLIIIKPVVSGSDAVDPLSATLLRLVTATIVLWLISVIRGRGKMIIRHLRDTRAMAFVLLGAIIGPFIGMWLLHVSLKLIHAGIAAILMATTPIMILPIVMIVYREKITWRALVGALVTTVGVVILLVQK